jgi:hypothetical protein
VHGKPAFAEELSNSSPEPLARRVSAALLGFLALNAGLSMEFAEVAQAFAPWFGRRPIAAQAIPRPGLAPGLH